MIPLLLRLGRFGGGGRGLPLRWRLALLSLGVVILRCKAQDGRQGVGVR